jgi:hypothetical protein
MPHGIKINLLNERQCNLAPALRTGHEPTASSARG